ncbi:DUF6804 family protein [Spirosoma validum]|uniref:DUF6804 family protein n=1 Tax=Spirosoma validum TaxID=2771355 RepID=UPI0037440103
MNIYKTTLLVTAAFIVLATLARVPLPHGLILILRIASCGLAIYSAILVKDSIVAVMGLLMIAVLWNPFVSIGFTQPTRSTVDSVVAFTFVLLALRPLKTQNEE